MNKKEKNNNKLFYFNKNNLNTCYYSNGDKHATCPHPNYCIFNKQVIQLEKNIFNLEREVSDKISDLKFIIDEGTENSANYFKTERRLSIIQDDLIKLNEFKQKIINMEVKQYGFMEI